MRIFRDNLNTLTYKDIEHFINERHRENVRLEYKEDFSDASDREKRKDTFQIAKEVSAFANQYGGVIVYGVKEKANEDGVPEEIVGIDKSKEAYKKIRDVCLDTIFPPIEPEIGVYELENAPDKEVVVVRVEMSDVVPHVIDGRTRFYVRGLDSCKPRPMADEEIRLLLNKREKAVDFRQRLLLRAYQRVFSTDMTKKELKNPFMFSAIPLYPLRPLVDKEKLLELHEKSKVSWNKRVPLPTERIKTASDSIYCYSPQKEEGKTINSVAISQYGEINTYGQISYCENAITSSDSQKGIFLKHELGKLFSMANYISNFYKNIGFWGIVRLTVDLRNCIGVKVYPAYDNLYFLEPLGEIEVDGDIKIEKDYKVSDLVDNPEMIVAEIIQELLWCIGSDIHNRVDMHTIRHWIKTWKLKVLGNMMCSL